MDNTPTEGTPSDHAAFSGRPIFVRALGVLLTAGMLYFIVGSTYLLAHDHDVNTGALGLAIAALLGIIGLPLWAPWRRQD